MNVKHDYFKNKIKNSFVNGSGVVVNLRIQRRANGHFSINAGTIIRILMHKLSKFCILKIAKIFELYSN